MLENLRDRMHDHEEIPPVGTWERIASELDGTEKVVYMPEVNSGRRRGFSGLAVAASIAVLIIATIFLLNRDNKSNGTIDNDQNTTAFNNYPSDDKRYITVTSPGGQRIKVSSKFSGAVNFLYDNPQDNSVWAKKFTEWREIMQNETLTPTTTNFLDIMEMSDFLEQAN